MSGFDGQFVINEAIRCGYRVEPIMNGSKIITCTITRKTGDKVKITLKGSLLFLQGSLDRLAKDFEVETKDLYKGTFPFGLEDTNYSGPLPDVKYYPTGSMSDEKKAF